MRNKIKMYFISFVFYVCEKWTKYFGLIITNENMKINIGDSQPLERNIQWLIYNCLNKYLQQKGKDDLLNIIIKDIQIEKSYDHFILEVDLNINLIIKKFKCFGEEFEIQNNLL